ncbi:hypothetical protein [Paractinoplanes lichenicola]|uniref:Uncharacterized protein n=1 Tax=Paractinoplanes lichenicola TaxID=2802976 RepID=A0ABS1VNC2_9ACTN|nr:hypothetical protein [Actinoplanes lichenicola]MBL7255237.1 hypothetical protein [Actinoplanes lichenicola]
MDRNTVRVPGAKIAFVLGGDDDPATVDDFDVVVTLDDGSRWSATLVTLPAIERTMDRWRGTGECLDGAFFQSQDLVILRHPGVTAATDVLSRLVAAGQIPYTLVRLEDAD